MRSTASILGADFKALIAAVTRFPSVGAFIGSELIHLRVGGSQVSASMFGVVLARASRPAAGEIQRFAIDERPIAQFATVIRNKGEVKLSFFNGQAIFKCGTRSIQLATVESTPHETIKPSGSVLTLNKKSADLLSYLSKIAMQDSSRPELCCVALEGGRAMACNQTAIAVLKTDLATDTRVTLPLPLLSALKVGDTIHSGKTETVLTTPEASYSMPAPVRAQKDFPAKHLLQYEKKLGDEITLFDGTRLVEALIECGSIVGAVSRTRAVIKLTLAGTKLEISAQNGGVRYRKSVTVDKEGEAEMVLPMDEAVQAAPLFAQKKVRLRRGGNGETFISFAGGWCMFPQWEE